MKKLILALCAFLMAGCQDVVNVQKPEDYEHSFNELSWERAFEGFWTGMNNSYVFWDIDSTDWDAVYREYRPKFAALGDWPGDGKGPIAKQYLIEITKNLADGHFVLKLEGDPGAEIRPSLGRFFETRGADFYSDPNAWPSNIMESEIAEGNFLRNFIAPKWNEDLILNAFIKTHYPAYDAPALAPQGTVSDFRDGFAYFFDEHLGIMAGKIPFGDGVNHILYFRFSDFALMENILAPDPYFDRYREVWVYFLNYLHDPLTKGVIVDVRGNNGGALVDLSYLWGNMISEERRHIAYNKQKMGDGRLDFSPLTPLYIFRTPDDEAILSKQGQDLEVPLALLINEFSVSCAEMSALIVHALGGTLVGGTTYGAIGPGGLPNILFNAGSFSTIGINTRTQIAQTLDLHKNSFEGKGVPPDYPVPFDYNAIRGGSDKRLEEAVRVIKANQ